ncbi:MAG TPA: phosphoribosylglycinamide formyltransferase [Acidimicrobiales bacterium]|nr:phosphoribosylglycinamide formyltransferase [Acidimicrobiales bacterium]
MRLAVLVSGTGSILEAIANSELPVALVLADRQCPALEKAQSQNIPTVVLQRESFGKDFDRIGYTKRLTQLLEEENIDLVAMAGFGTILEQPIYESFNQRILNTHPSLLPAFPGWDAVQDALDHGVKVSGCTVHIATREVDSGPILAQEAVPVFEEDNASTLHERIKEIEKNLYIETIKEIVEQK